MGAHMLREERAIGGLEVEVALDNQAAGTRAHGKETGSGAYLTEMFVEEVGKVVKGAGRPGKVTVRWVPGHEDVEGNETADGGAKDAAGGETSERRKLPECLRKGLPKSKAALKQKFKTSARERATARFRKSAQYGRMKYADPGFTGATFAKLVEGTTRGQRSLLTMLRTGHIAMNKHLHRINKAESAMCGACGEREETVQHFLLHCPAYERHREAMRYELGRRAGNISYLMSSKKATKGLMKFVYKTGRLRGTFGDVRFSGKEAATTRSGDRGA